MKILTILVLSLSFLVSGCLEKQEELPFEREEEFEEQPSEEEYDRKDINPL